MNRFVLKNNFIKVYISHFSINIFIETISQNCVLKTVSLSKMTSFTSMEEVGGLLDELHVLWQATINGSISIIEVL